MNNALSRSLFVLTLTAQAAPVLAQATYSVAHSFDFRPQGDVAEVVVYDFRHAWVNAPWLDDEEHSPGTQNPGFDIFGTDSPNPGGYGWRNSGIIGSFVPVLYNSWVVDATTGINFAFCVEAEVNSARAEACNAFDIPPWSNSSPLSIPGRIESYGYANAWGYDPGNPRLCYAVSTAGVGVRGGLLMANGSIQWYPGFLFDSVGGDITDSNLIDPIEFTATNTATGAVTEHTLLDINTTVSGQGLAEWSGNTLTVDAPRLTLDIDIPAQVIDPAQAGTMRLEVDNGVVQTAVGTGIFAGVLPPVGQTTPFTVLMPDITLRYDLGLDPTQPWRVDAKFSGGGDALTSDPGASCPADINADGLLNFFDVAEYLGLYNEHSPQADLAEPFGEINFFDLAAYLTLYSAGCADVTD